jgi:hypothetical protein
MRKFEKFWPHALAAPVERPQSWMRSRAFRLLLVVAGVFILTAAFAPRANATLLMYFNFNDTTLGGDPDYNCDPLGLQASVITTNYDSADVDAVEGLALNIAPGDTESPNLGLGLSRSAQNEPGRFDFAVDAGFFQDMSLSFAVNSNGNGFETVTLSYNLSGGVGTFTDVGSATIVTGPGQIITFVLPAAVNNQPGLVLRLEFTGEQSNGVDLQNTVDNIQLNGIAIPEPATVVGGLLGVLGLGWHQRRRLIRSVRLRRA